MTLLEREYFVLSRHSTELDETEVMFSRCSFMDRVDIIHAVSLTLQTRSTISYHEGGPLMQTRLPNISPQGQMLYRSLPRSRARGSRGRPKKTVYRGAREPHPLIYASTRTGNTIHSESRKDAFVQRSWCCTGRVFSEPRLVPNGLHLSLQ